VLEHGGERARSRCDEGCRHVRMIAHPYLDLDSHRSDSKVN